MAEGWLRALAGDRYRALSAGIEAHGLNTSAVAVMAERGVDISDHTSKRWGELTASGGSSGGAPLDYVVTVCGHADTTCPDIPVACKKIHVGFDDPPALARDATSPEQALDHYRRVRDDIERFVRRIDDYLEGGP